MKFRDGRKIWITFQVCDVNGPIMSVGKFCTKKNDGEIVVDRIRNHFELEC